jgi:AcrR family transcriptional regulator
MPRGDTRQLILDAARATLAEEGIVGISTRRVAGRAGVNQALVHYYFKSIEQLLLAVLLEVRDEVASRLDNVFDGSRELASEWRSYADRAAGKDYPADLPSIWLQAVVMAATDPNFADAYRAGYFEATHDAIYAEVARYFPANARGRARADALTALMMAVQRGVIIDRLLGSTRGHKGLFDLMEEIIGTSIEVDRRPQKLRDGAA